MTIRPPKIVPLGAVGVIDRVLGRIRADVCTVQRLSSSRGPGGAPSNAYGTVAVATCRVQQPTGGTEVNVGGRQTQLVDYVVRFARPVLIGDDDRIVIDDLTLQVVSSPSAGSGFECVAYCVATG